MKLSFNTKFKILLYKNYFDKGFGLVSGYLKYPLALFALYEVVLLENIKYTLVMGGIWFVLSCVLGWWWYHYDWYSAEIEVGNRINPFVREVREKLK